jgi:cell division septation protein DedD
MLFRRQATQLLLAFATLFFWACGSLTETEDTQETSSETARHTSPRVEFETRTDTVAMQRRSQDAVAGRRKKEQQIRYMVQIGAFKDPKYASAVQIKARERYHLPVLNDYNTTYALYQIRIGFFETRQDAYKFRERMRREYPNDYTDSWVVQLKR